MVRSCEVQAGVNGAVVVRRGTGVDDVEHLRATATRLAAAAHPGVVEVIASTGTDDCWELELVHAGRPLEALERLRVEQVATVTAALAATISDLHAAGIVHGAIDASHVLVSGHDRPVLCGFGPRAAAMTEADDVAAIGELIVTLIGTDAELEPLPERRWSRRASWRGASGWERRALLLVADHACAEPPTRRPSAGRLAVEIADAVPRASAPPTPARSRPTSPESRLPSLASAALAVIVLAVMAAAVVAPAIGGPVATSSMTATAEPEPTDRLPTTSTTRATPTTMASLAATREVTTVVEGGRRYEVGAPGDVVVLGDWDGDGQRTAAVLRPSTGEVFVFATWSTGVDLVVRAVTVVADGVDLIVAPGDRRDRLVVRRGDGTEVPVPEAVT